MVRKWNGSVSTTSESGPACNAYNPSGRCDHPYGPTFLTGGCKGAQIEKNGILEPIIWPGGSKALRHTLAPQGDPLRRYCPCACRRAGLACAQ